MVGGVAMRSLAEVFSVMAWWVLSAVHIKLIPLHAGISAVPSCSGLNIAPPPKKLFTFLTLG
jgi:hypothetical protein